MMQLGIGLKRKIRLNNINWNHIGQNGQEKDMELGIEFIKKLAVFCIENNITPTLPFMTDLTSYFGNCAIDDAILEKCNKDVRNVIKYPSLSTSIVNYYLKASILADKDVKYVACINVYEPIIRLFENGGDFVYRERGMSFASSGLIPLENRFNRFKNI